MNTNVNKMTEGNPFKLIILFGIPVLIGNLFQQLYNVMDSIIVGAYVGTNGLAAVGSVGAIQFFFFSFCMGLSNGISIVIAQHFGAGNDTAVKKSIINGAILALSVSILMSTLGVSCAKICLELMNTPDAIIQDATLYMRSTCAGIVGVAMYNTVSEMLRALGDSKTPLKFLIIAALTNIALDLLFIIQFNMGVLGAGIATAASQYLAAIGITIYAFARNPYFTLQKETLVIDKSIMARCAKTGMPVAFQFSMIAVSCIALQIVINGFGAVVVATNTVVSKVENVVVQVFFTLTTALQAYTGQNMGAQKMDRVRQGFRCGLTILLLYNLCMIPCIFLFGEQIISIFVNDPEVITLGAQALKITSSFYIFLGFIYITRGTLNGAGDSKFALMGGCLEVLGRVCFAKPLTMIGAIGVYGIWIATGLTWFTTGMMGIIRYKQGKWIHNAGKIAGDTNGN